jgi:DNA-binding response OmpR family regulator
MAKILVVDDSKDLLELLTIMLKLKGHQAATARNVMDTIIKIKYFSPDLIMLDVLLGNESGKELCKSIKDNHPNISVLLMSANPALLKNYRTYKADDIIEKPFDVNILNEKINNLLTLGNKKKNFFST